MKACQNHRLKSPKNVINFNNLILWLFMPCALWSMEKTQKKISRLSFDREFLIPSCLQSCLFPLRDCIIYCFRFIHSNSCRSMKIMTLIMFNKGFSPSCSHIFVSYLSDVRRTIWYLRRCHFICCLQILNPWSYKGCLKLEIFIFQSLMKTWRQLKAQKHFLRLFKVNFFHRQLHELLKIWNERIQQMLNVFYGSLSQPSQQYRFEVGIERISEGKRKS